MSDTVTRDAAYEALRFIYPNLNVTKSQITPQAAAFAFKVLVKVDQGSRLSAGLFKLNRVYTSWSSIPTAFAQAVYAAVKDSDAKLKNAAASAFIAQQHRRNLQAHLQMPDVMPCPDFKN